MCFSDDSLHDKTAMFLLTRTKVGISMKHLENSFSEVLQRNTYSSSEK
jgi:hypothetical protein